jgi:YNFM family putative membrane transporter
MICYTQDLRRWERLVDSASMKQFEPASLENYHRPVVLLGAAAFCVAANMRLAEPLIPRIAQEFSATVGDASVVSTAFALAYGITQLICGPLGDRYGKFRMVSIAMTLAAIVVFAASLVQSLTALALIRLVAGAAAAAIISLGLAYVADIVPYDRRQAILARILTGQLIGVVFGQAAGAMIIEFAGWRVAFAILGSAFALVAMALWIELRSERVNKVRNSAPLSLRGMIRQYLAIAESSHSRLLLLAVFAEGFLFFGALAYFGAFLRSTLAIDYFK